VEEIQDRSKGDALSKGLVIPQTTWFLAQCIIRSVKGFLLTELELVTLAFAALNAVTYFFWWNKPVDVRSSLPVRVKLGPREVTPVLNTPPVASQVLTDQASSVLLDGLTGYLRRCFTSVITSTKCTYSNIQDSFRRKDMMVNLLAHLHYPAVAFFRVFLRIIYMINGHDPDLKLRVPTFYAAHLIPNPRRFFLMSIACSVIGTLFGAIHCIAWSPQFISPQE
jgi:hypothetical protein